METEEKTSKLAKALLWTGIATLLVGVKLLLSFVIPGLKTPGELLLSAGLLLACTAQLFSMRARVSK